MQDKPDARLQHRRRRHSSGGDRETWSRKVEYFFAGLGYAVGLGNIWRFPYLCYRNGGGAFLIPYLVCLVAAGFPMMFLEMSFGQFASVGPITIWKICPLFKGIGWAILMVLLLVNTYYNVLIAYSLYYLFASITNELPWGSCGHAWNTKNCVMGKSGECSACLPPLLMITVFSPRAVILPYPPFSLHHQWYQWHQLLLPELEDAH